MRPSQESGVYTFMNLLPLTSIIEGGGSQRPSPFTVLMIFFLHCNRRFLEHGGGGKKMKAEPCNSEKLGKTAVGSVGARRNPVFNILALVCH